MNTDDEIAKEFAEKCALIPGNGEIDEAWVRHAVEKYAKSGLDENEAKS